MNYLEKELNNLIKSDTQILNFLQNNVLDGIWFWNLEKEEDEWMSRSFWETLGYNPSDMPHKALSWQSVIDQDDLSLVLDSFTEHFKNPDKPYDIVVRYMHKKGDTIWIRSRGIAVRDSTGVPIRMLGAHTNITKQKETELRLKRFTQVIEGADLATWEWNIMTGDLRLNDNWANLIPKPKGNLGNQFIDLWKDTIHPDDIHRTRLALINHFKLNTDSFECEVRLKSEDKQWRWTLCKGKVIVKDTDNKAVLMTGYFQDISERKENEKVLLHYKELLDRSNEVARIGTWDVDLIKETVTWSEVTKQIHETEKGFIPNLEGGINFYKAGKNRDRISTVFTKAVEEGIPFDEELLIITDKKNEKWIRTIGIPVIQKGRVSRVYGVFHDIDTLKKSREETERLLKVKAEKNERLTNFSYIVSHNLRSHSVNLNMLVKMIRENYGDFSSSEVFKMLEKSTVYLSETIQDLDQIAEMHVSIAEGLEKQSIEPFIRKAANSIRPSLLESGGELVVSQNLDFHAQIIPAYLDSVILNLLTNAIRYRSPERTLKIKFEVYSENDYIVMSVADNGLGIDLDKHRSKLFKMYKVFHEHKEAKGIGLFITKSQVDAMNGKIFVESEVNSGSTFKIYLRR